jgi:thiosulfate reductase cytochrome b subunit
MHEEPKRRSRLRRLLVNRVLDVRFLAAWLLLACGLAYVVTLLDGRISFGAAFGIAVLGLFFVGLSTLADE